MAFEAGEVALKAEPGQFIHVRCTSQLDPYLRRPFSVYRVHGKVVEVVYRVVGRGTLLLTRLRRGDLLDVFGPLGRGFTIGLSPALLVGEGSGIASLVYLAERLSQLGVPAQAILAAESRDEIIAEEELGILGLKVRTVYGRKEEYQERVERLVEEALRGKEALQVYGCGSNHLLARVSRVAWKYNTPCQVSLYQNMACGIGACLCCARKFKSNSRVVYRLVCREGPVFNSREVLWEN